MILLTVAGWRPGTWPPDQRKQDDDLRRRALEPFDEAGRLLQGHLTPIDVALVEEAEEDGQGVGIGLHRPGRLPDRGAVGEELLDLRDRQQRIPDHGPRLAG